MSCTKEARTSFPTMDNDAPNPNHNPAAVLASTLVARTLTISDQHANILLVTKKSETDAGAASENQQKALLKLTMVPFHKTALACLPPSHDQHEDDYEDKTKEINTAKARTDTSKEQADQKDLRVQEEKGHSAKVLEFLSKFDWRMISESGAEYSYHEAYPKTMSLGGENTKKDNETVSKEPPTKRAKTIKKSIKSSSDSVMKAELIFPASERQVARATPCGGFVLVAETPAIYQAVTKPFIDSVVLSGSISWLQNIVQVKKERERLLWNAQGWILNIDTKWRTHPDPLTVPRSEWFQHGSTADLYCLGILKRGGIASLRDLNGHDHLEILKEMIEQGPKIIEQIYGVEKDQLRIFVHYQPQFYHFHVHFTRLENDIGAQVEKAHLLSDIIQDLELDPECFQKKTITYKLGLKDKLYQLLKHHGNEKK